jgi:metallo-beta-lactamase class B
MFRHTAIAMACTGVFFTAMCASAADEGVSSDTRPIDCGMCEAWNAPQAPFKLHGRSWYVGPRGLSSVLIDSGEGLVLIDGALPQSAGQIAANIRALGFDIADLEWIVNSHAHFDHAGGIAALQRMSGAKVGASARGAEGLRLGNATPDDPQAGMGMTAMAFPPVAEVVEIADGQRIAIGDIELVAHYTPGHTPGGVTWAWRSCEDGDCIDMVYADSLTAFSAPDFRFTRDAALISGFQRSVRRVADLPCDLLVSTHPEASGLFERKAAGGDGDLLTDGQGCRTYAERSAARLLARIAEESDTGK